MVRKMDNIIEGELLTPIPRKKGESITMDFKDIFKELKEGKKVRRMSWPEDDFGELKNEHLGIFTGGKFYDHWNISLGDIDGQDWYVKE